MSEGSAQLILEEVRLLRSEFKSDIEKIHEKVNSVIVSVAEIKKDNQHAIESIKDIDILHKDCDGKKALKLINDAETDKKVKESNQYKVGEWILTVGVIVIIVGSILGLIFKFTK